MPNNLKNKYLNMLMWEIIVTHDGKDAQVFREIINLLKEAHRVEEDYRLSVPIRTSSENLYV